MRHKAGKENETQTKHTGRNIVIAVVVVLAAFCAYAGSARKVAHFGSWPSMAR